MQKKIFLMQFLIFFCYELSVCPLIFKSDKVYFASSLIAKPMYKLRNVQLMVNGIGRSFVLWSCKIRNLNVLLLLQFLIIAPIKQTNKVCTLVTIN